MIVRTLLHTLLIVLGVPALSSGLLLMLHPDGSSLGAPLSLLARTPFADFFWPGAILAAFFGMGSLLASLALGRGWRHAPRFAQWIGAGHVVWILFQAYWFPELSWLQLLFGAIGLSICLVAERYRRSLPT
jgi:hypothetical protein